MTTDIICFSEAKRAGLRIYFTGKPCRRGHLDSRFTSSGSCCSCVREKTARNAEAKSEYDRARYIERGEELRAKLRKTRASDGGKHVKEVLDWQRTNPDRVRQYKDKNKAMRRSAMRDRLPPWFGELDSLVALEAADLAKRREAVTGFAWHVDHMVPLQARKACGLHCAANLQVIPAALNLRKLNRLVLTKPGAWIKAA